MGIDFLFEQDTKSTGNKSKNRQMRLYETEIASSQ
jgi:hypothetical protein